MKRWRTFFAVAAAYNLLGGTAGFLTWRQQFEQLGVPAPNYPFFVQLVFLCVVCLGVGYALVAVDPLAHRGVVVVGLLTKLAGIAMSYWAIASGQMPASTWWQPLVNDLGWAVGFAWFLARPPQRQATTQPDATASPEAGEAREAA